MDAERQMDAAPEGYTETLDHEIRRFGVRAVLVEPSFTNTDLLENERGTAARIESYARDRAATATTPKLRYPVAAARKLSLLRRLVPSATFARSLRKQFGLLEEAL